MATRSAGTPQSEASDPGSHRGAPAWRIRRALPTDLDALLCLEAGFPGDRLSRRQLRRHLVSARADLGVLGRRGHPLQGYVLVLSHRQRRDVRLYSIVVDPALRGQGAGRALLDWALRRSRQRGAAGLRLEVRVDNPAARALYAARGFREIGGRTGYYEDGADAVCLRRPFV